MTKHHATSFDRALGIILKTERIMAGMSQSYIASQFGITYQQLQKIEAGVNRIPVERLCRICELLGLSVQDVLARAGSTKTVVQERPRQMLEISRLMNGISDKKARAILKLVRSMVPESEAA